MREAIAVGIPIRRSRVLSLRATPSGFSQLGTSVVGSRAEPFTSQYSSQFECRVLLVCCVQWLLLQLQVKLLLLFGDLRRPRVIRSVERVQWASGLRAYNGRH